MYRSYIYDLESIGLRNQNIRVQAIHFFYAKRWRQGLLKVITASTIKKKCCNMMQPKFMYSKLIAQQQIVIDKSSTMFLWFWNLPKGTGKQDKIFFQCCFRTTHFSKFSHIVPYASGSNYIVIS